jgi:hypothetical protein
MEGLVIKKLSKKTLEMQQMVRNPKRGGTKRGFNQICYNNQEDVATASSSVKIKDGSTSMKLSATSRKRFLGKKSNTTTADDENTDNKQDKDDNTTVDNDTKWKEEWDNHCQEVYTTEYQTQEKKHIQERHITVTYENAMHIPGIRKYYAQRYQLFSKYDEGIKLDYGK